MILAIGEILADLFGREEDGKLNFTAFCGGAPFNMAVNARRAGAEVGFIGRVGDDPIGRFVISQAEKADLNYLEIQKDPVKSTTIAVVSVTNGERDFAFLRHDTADYCVSLCNVDFGRFRDLQVVHLGSLMLSERRGRRLAAAVVDEAKRIGAKLSFDMNFRRDIFRDLNAARRAYASVVKASDILKFSEDELFLYTGKDDLDAAVRAVGKTNGLIVVTRGERGSVCYGTESVVEAVGERVTPVDTTGAGDAFFGTFVAALEGKTYSRNLIKEGLQRANLAGAEATRFKGALRL